MASPQMVARAAPPEGYKPILSNSPFGWGNGPVFEKADEDGGWQRGFRVEEKHANVGGFCHGGMLMTFADIALSRAALDAGGFPSVTVRLVTDFVGPAPLGSWVTGHARITGRDGKLISLVGELRVEEEVVAVISGVFKYLGSVPSEGEGMHNGRQ